MAIEDQRFYQDDAIDVTGILRSAVRDLSAGEPLQGASTITMQLIRNLYLPDYQHTLRQKIIEAKLAVEYAKRHSRREILNDLPQQRPLRHRSAARPPWASRPPRRCSSTSRSRS